MGLISEIFGKEGIAGNVTDILVKAGILTDPELIQKAKESLQNYELKTKENITRLEEIAQQDRVSARGREVEVKDKTNRNISYVTIIGFFVLIGILFYVEIPETAKMMISTLVGYLGANVQSIYNYYFGSSSGSANKSDSINKMIDQIQQKV